MVDADLDCLSLEELKNLQENVRKAIEICEVRRKQEARAVLEAKAREMGYCLSELIEGATKPEKEPQAVVRSPWIHLA